MNTSTILQLNGIWAIEQTPQTGLLAAKARPASAEMKEAVNQGIKLKGNVPGIVHHDLLETKLVDDPYYRMNELDQQWVGNSDWAYSRTFKMTAKQVQKANIILNCDGLDTFATVYVNDKKVGDCENMYIQKRFYIKEAVKVGSNKIRVEFQSALQVALQRARQFLKSGPHKDDWNWMCDIPTGMIRKAPSHFGWDWGVCLPSCGIYKDISVECFDGARVLYLNNEQKHSKNLVKVKLKAIVESHKKQRATVQFQLGDQRAQKKVLLQPGANHVEASIEVRNPELWWPNGYGDQKLYDAQVTVECADESHSMIQKIGLRDVQLITKEDEDKQGTSFFFEVNRVPVYAKGSNWIPSDIFDSRLTDDQVDWELSSAAAAHNTMIRVWGGGLYERDFFYQRCDELGLLVWQDFMFACRLFPAHEEFLSSVREEVTHQIRRLAHHPSIALWCGNNENEMALTWGQQRENPALCHAEYDQLYIQTIMPIVTEEDPDRRYWGSSPSNGIQLYGDYQDETRGDVHYWGVWHGDKPFSEYLTIKPRFSSEFGFQSFASPETMATVTNEDDRNIFSPVFEHHQRAKIGNLRIYSHIARQFRAPNGYENTIYMSQVLQALSIKVACEHWRRCKPYTMGALIWQLNDIWPVASWSSLEYDGRWKMMHYAQKKFFAPLLVSTVENDGKLEVWGTSDINAPVKGTLSLELVDLSGKCLWSESRSVRLQTLGNKKLFQTKIESLLDEKAKASSILLVELKTDQGTVSNEHIFVPFKAMELQKPKLTQRLYEQDGQICLDLCADTLMPYAWIRTGEIQGTWSDNGMHLLPGKTATLTFKPRYDATIKELKKNLVIHDLYNSTR